MRTHTRTCFFASILVLAGALAAQGEVTAYLSPEGSDAAGDGSRDKPWKSLHFATGKIDEGSTLVLLDGLYEGSQSIERQFTRGCTIRAEHSYLARLRSPADQNRVLSCYDAAHVNFQGLEMYGSGGTRGEFLVHISTEKAHHLQFEDCIIHDCHNNDLVKINSFAHDILFRRCIFYNQTDHPGDEHFDINTVTDVAVEDSILFNDYAGSGRHGRNQSHAFVVIGNSGDTPDVTRRVAFRRNIFLNWQGLPDEAYILLGEDGKPFMEAQDVMIENNLFIHNSDVRSWGTLLFKGGLRNITVRANTVVGHPAVRGSGAFAAVCLRIEKNPPMSNVTFCNNIWCDSGADMPRFSISNANVFADDSPPTLRNNLYWNGGKKIPTESTDVITPDRDPARQIADPRLPHSDGPGFLPRFELERGQFSSGQKTIAGEFARLVDRYAAVGDASPAIANGDPACMPDVDILGRRRGPRPTIGCFEGSAAR